MAAPIDQRVLVRAAHLKALTTSDNPHEAANALAALQRLLLQHEIDIADVDASDPMRAATGAHIDLKDPLYVRRKPLPDWQVALLVALAEASGCAEFHATDPDGEQRFGFLAGRKEDVAYVKAVWSRTVALLVRLGDKEFRAMHRQGVRVTHKVRRGFFFGAVAGIEAQLRQVQAEFAKTEKKSAALTIVDARRSAAEKAIDRLAEGCQKLEGNFVPDKVDLEAYDAGMAAGEAMHVGLPAELRKRAKTQRGKPTAHPKVSQK
jgi:hypothetical protein